MNTGIIKKQHRLYAAWDYLLEEEHINGMSTRGWHLIEGSSVTQTYQREEGKRYIIRLDYNPRGKSDHRYYDTYTEMGWEYLSSTFNGWHYFRKPLREGTSPDDEEYMIYSDLSSRKEMHQRFCTLANVLSAFYVILSLPYILVFFEGYYLRALYGVVLLFCAAVFQLGNHALRQIAKGNRPKFRISIVAVLCVLLLGLIGLFADTGSNHNYFSSTVVYLPSQETMDQNYYLFLEKEGYYWIDTQIDAPKEAVLVSLEDESGNILWQRSENTWGGFPSRIHLNRGEYVVTFDLGESGEYYKVAVAIRR